MPNFKQWNISGEQLLDLHHKQKLYVFMVVVFGQKDLIVLHQLVLVLIAFFSLSNVNKSMFCGVNHWRCYGFADTDSETDVSFSQTVNFQSHAKSL